MTQFEGEIRATFQMFSNNLNFSQILLFKQFFLQLFLPHLPFMYAYYCAFVDLCSKHTKDRRFKRDCGVLTTCTWHHRDGWINYDIVLWVYGYCK